MERHIHHWYDFFRGWRLYEYDKITDSGHGGGTGRMFQVLIMILKATRFHNNVPRIIKYNKHARSCIFPPPNPPTLLCLQHCLELPRQRLPLLLTLLDFHLGQDPEIIWIKKKLFSQTQCAKFLACSRPPPISAPLLRGDRRRPPLPPPPPRRNLDFWKHWLRTIRTSGKQRRITSVGVLPVLVLLPGLRGVQRELLQAHQALLGPRACAAGPGVGAKREHTFPQQIIARRGKKSLPRSAGGPWQKKTLIEGGTGDSKLLLGTLSSCTPKQLDCGDFTPKRIVRFRKFMQWKKFIIDANST